MITLSNRHYFEYAAACALGFDGQGWPHEQPLRWLGLLDPSLFTVFSKTLTRNPRPGNLRWYNPAGCIRLIRNGSKIIGVHNAVGLTNPGIDWYCRKIGPKVDSIKVPLAGSIYGDPHELGEMAQMLNDFDLVALEINAFCPNTPDGILTNTKKIIQGCFMVRDASRFPIILKVSPAHNVESFIKQVEDYIEAISINSVPWQMIFPDQKSPLSHLGGGAVSGKVVQSFTWGMVKKLVELTDIPVIGPSVWDHPDIEKLRRIGAQAVSFGSVFIPYPCRPTQFVGKDQRELEKKQGAQTR